MEVRRDAGLAAAATALGVDEIARGEGGVGTVGQIAMEPESRPRCPGPPRCSSTCATPRRIGWPRCSIRSARRRRPREGARLRGHRRAGLDDRPDLLRPRSRRARPARLRAGRRPGLRAPERSPPRRRRDRRVVPAAMVFSPRSTGSATRPMRTPPRTTSAWPSRRSATSRTPTSPRLQASSRVRGWDVASRRSASVYGRSLRTDRERAIPRTPSRARSSRWARCFSPFSW